MEVIQIYIWIRTPDTDWILLAGDLRSLHVFVVNVLFIVLLFTS